MNIGKVGEKIAQEYMISKSFEILETNYHSRYGEIDIICKNDRYIIFVEVKSKLYSSNSELPGRVNIFKQRKIIKTILDYISNYEFNEQPRIDVIEVIIFPKCYKINHIENAFSMEGEL